MSLRQAAEMALEALEDIFGKNKVDVGAINALRAALAEANECTVEVNGKRSAVLTAMMNSRTKAARAEAEEPVAWAYINSDGECEEIEYGRYSEADDSCITHLYTHPPRRVPLTEDEIIDILQRLHERSGGLHNYYLHAIKVIKERAHGIGGDE